MADVVVDRDGVRVCSTPDGRMILADANPFDLGGETVKENRQRTVRRVELTGGTTVFVKISRVNSPRTWLRDLWRGSKAKLEFTNALRLRELRIAAVEPLAYAEAGRLLPGASVLLTRAVFGTTPLDEALTKELSARRRRDLAAAFGAFVAAMHEAGVVHPDAHPGNFLVGPGSSFTLIDLHALRFGPVGERESTAMLVQLNRWFQERVARTDRARFFTAYQEARPTFAATARSLEEATTKSNLDFRQDRLKRWLRDNRDTRRIARGPYAGFSDRMLPPTLLDAMLTNPDGAIASPDATILKNSRTSTVVALRHDGETYLVKRFNLRSRAAALKNAFRPSPALRSWLHGRSFADRGIPTASPLLMIQRHTVGLAGTGFVVFEYLVDAAELQNAVRLPDLSRAVLHAWAERLGRVLRTMHEQRIAHRDLKPSNVFLRGLSNPAAATPVLIDLVGTTVGGVVSPEIRRKNLTRLNAGFPPSTASNSLRLRVLYAYLGAQRADWKTWWRAIHAASRVKWNRASTTFAGGSSS